MVSIIDYVRGSPGLDVRFGAFPDTLVGLHSMSGVSPKESITNIDFLKNRPHIDHWLAVAASGLSSEYVLGDLCDGAREDADYLIQMYSVIPARDRHRLRYKLVGSSVYRNPFEDCLYNMRWVSAKYVHDGWGHILSIQSPILFFDASFSESFAVDWCSAFVSFLGYGFLDCVVHYSCLCLGDFRVNLLELSSINSRQ